VSYLPLHCPQAAAGGAPSLRPPDATARQVRESRRAAVRSGNIKIENR